MKRRIRRKSNRRRRNKTRILVYLVAMNLHSIPYVDMIVTVCVNFYFMAVPPIGEIISHQYNREKDSLVIKWRRTLKQFNSQSVLSMLYHWF